MKRGDSKEFHHKCGRMRIRVKVPAFSVKRRFYLIIMNFRCVSQQLNKQVSNIFHFFEQTHGRRSVFGQW